MPGLHLAVRAIVGELGANPVSELLNQLGLAALMLLVACLACSPVKALTGWTWPVRIRKTLGVAAFVYALLHVTVWVALDKQFGAEIVDEILSSDFIGYGLLAFALLVPLAATSTVGIPAALHIAIALASLMGGV